MRYSTFQNLSTSSDSLPDDVVGTSGHCAVVLEIRVAFHIGESVDSVSPAARLRDVVPSSVHQRASHIDLLAVGHQGTRGIPGSSQQWRSVLGHTQGNQHSKQEKR